MLGNQDRVSQRRLDMKLVTETPRIFQKAEFNKTKAM